MKQADQVKEVQRDNKNQVMLKKEQLKIRAIEKGQLLIEGAEEEIIEKIEKLFNLPLLNAQIQIF